MTRGRYRSTARRGGRALRAALAASTVLPALLIVASTAGAGAPPEFGVESRWRAFAPGAYVQQSRLALDVAGRTAYTFQSAEGRLTVRAWDLDRMRPRGGPLTEPLGSALGSAVPAVADETTASVVLAPTAPQTGTPVPPSVRIYGVRAGALTRLGEVTTRFPAGYDVLGLVLDAPRGRMLAIAAPSGGTVVKAVGAGVGNVLLDSWRLADLGRGLLVSDRSEPYRVPPTCGQLVTTRFPAGLLVSPDGRTVTFGCLSNRGVVTLAGPNAGDVVGVATFDLAVAAAGTGNALRIRSVPGNFGQGDSFAVPGIRRFVLSAAGESTTSVKVYDAAHGRFVGNVGLAATIAAAGVDPRNGRFYYIGGSGLGLFDSAMTPADQGVVHEDYATFLGTLNRGVEVDPRTRRVFVVNADDVVNGPDAYVAVFRDRGRVAATDLRPRQEDGLDAPERPGVTDSSRSADAGSYGAELRMVGGPNTLFYNASHLNTGGIVFRPGTRFVQLAAVRALRLTRDEASAEVVTAKQDGTTTSEVGHEPAAPVACTDFGYSSGTVEDDAVRVHCDVPRQEVAAAVSAEPGRIVLARTLEEAQRDDAVPSPIQVRSASTTLDTRRDGPLGRTVSTLRAEASGIDIHGVVQIGRVSASAVVSTHGRPGTATTTYERSVSGVVVDGTPICAEECPLDRVRQAIDEAFGGRVVVTFPEPFRFAAANGVNARLTDDPYHHVERVLFDDVPDDSTVSPAMEIVAYLDGTAPSRLSASLAALSAQQRYRIFAVGAEPPPPGPSQPAPSAAVDVPLPSVSVETDGPLHGHPDPEPPDVVAAPTGQGDLVTRLTEGLKVVFRSPRQLAAVAALWALLAVPVYLAARRRLLIELPFLRRPLEESS